MISYHLYFLGTGTSDGVPVINCRCPVCCSCDPRDRRMRSSVYLSLRSNQKEVHLLIDTSLDFRAQILQLQRFFSSGSFSLDAILYTHSHADHLLGLAEVRPLTHEKPLKLFSDPLCAKEIQSKFDYFFSSSVQKGGGIPEVELQTVVPDQELIINGFSFTVLPVKHGNLDIYGWRVGNFAYITDASFIPEKTFQKLQGVDYLILNGLRATAHPTHFSIAEAVAAAKRIAPKNCYLTHISHSHSHQEYQEKINQLNDSDCQIAPAYDGLELFWKK